MESDEPVVRRVVAQNRAQFRRVAGRHAYEGRQPDSEVRQPRMRIDHRLAGRRGSGAYRSCFLVGLPEPVGSFE